MISLLGKRPFIGRSDDMDKWLDEHAKERTVNPPIGGDPPPRTDEPTLPAPVTGSRSIADRREL